MTSRLSPTSPSIPDYRIRLCHDLLRIFAVPLLAALYIAPSVLLKCLLVVPLTVLWGYARNAYYDYQSKRDADRLGAVLVPRIRGRWPGNIDVLLRMMRGFKNGYIQEVFLELFQECDSTIINTRVLWVDQIITMDEEHMKFILSSGFNLFWRGWRQKERMEELLGNGIFNRDDEIWKMHRGVARPFFARERISDFHTFSKHADLTLDLLDSLAMGPEVPVHAPSDNVEAPIPQDGAHTRVLTAPVDAQDLFARFTLDTASEFLFGQNFDTIHGILPALHKAKDEDVPFKSTSTNASPEIPSAEPSPALSSISESSASSIDTCTSSLSASTTSSSIISSKLRPHHNQKTELGSLSLNMSILSNRSRSSTLTNAVTTTPTPTSSVGRAELGFKGSRPEGSARPAKRAKIQNSQNKEEEEDTTFPQFADAFEKAQVYVTMRARLGYWWPLAELFADKVRPAADMTKRWLDPLVRRALQDKRRRIDARARAEDRKTRVRAFSEAKLAGGISSRLTPLSPSSQTSPHNNTNTQATHENHNDSQLSERNSADDEHVGDENDAGAKNFLEHLVDTTDDVAVIRDQLLSILLASRDTTATLLTYIVYLFALHPDVAQKLRAEVIETHGTDRSPTYESLRECRYMRAVINETMRLFPPVPLNVRETRDAGVAMPSSPYQGAISNPSFSKSLSSSSSSPNDPLSTPPYYPPTPKAPVYVPPRTVVTYLPLLMQRNPGLWGADADVFNPGRWIGENGESKLDRLAKEATIFAPFSSGPRICLGQEFAYNEASFFLVRLLQRYDTFVLAPECQHIDSLPPTSWREPDTDACGINHACDSSDAKSKSASKVDEWKKARRGGPGRKVVERVWPAAALTLFVKGGLWVRFGKAPDAPTA